MPAGTDRLATEQIFHDRQAADRASSFRTGRADLLFDDASYLDHETWIRPAIAKLSPLSGRRILDYGCGHGMAAVVFARAGAAVTGFDLSPGYVNEARVRAQANRVTAEFVTADAEHLPYPPASFDGVWGNAILHHLDLARAGRELVRVLKPGGVAVFCEPWGGNPVLSLARRRLPYPGKERTPDEQPLTRRDLAPLRDLFPDLRVEGHQLTGMIRRVWRNPGVTRLLDAIDDRVLRWCPPMWNWCRYVVITLTKPPAPAS